MWSDNETTTDLLGFEVHRNLIAQLVTDPTLLPLTIGLFGDWGSGKSSIMRMLEAALQDKSDVAVIYFNGWQFEGYNDAKSAIIHAVLFELAKHGKLAPKLKKRLGKFYQSINWLRVGSTAYQMAVPLVLSQLYPEAVMMPSTTPLPPPQSDEQMEELFEDIENLDIEKLKQLKPADQALMGARLLRENFAKLIAETGLKSVVILVDDLDRCDPKRLVETLEAIKLFLTVPHVSFVIGADERIIRYAISKRYELSSLPELQEDPKELTGLVTDYVEKLIQIPYYLPRLSQSELESYMSLLFCQRNLQEDGFDTVHQAYRKSREADITATFGQQDIEQALKVERKSCPDELNQRLRWSSSVAPALSDTLKGNPRQTKRLLNAFVLRQKLAQAARIELDTGILIKILLLEQLRNNLFSQLYAWQASSKGTPSQMVVLEEWAQSDQRTLPEELRAMVGQDWGSTPMRIWLRMSPQLKDIDLRTYFWITRDKVTNISAGIGTLPRHIRHYLSEISEYKAGGIVTSTLASAIMQLPSEESSLFVDELSALLLRTTSNRHLIEGWRKLAVGAKSQGVVTGLIQTLGQMSKTAVPPIAPSNVSRVAQLFPSLEKECIGLLRSWTGGNNPLAKAAKLSLEELSPES